MNRVFLSYEPITTNRVAERLSTALRAKGIEPLQINLKRAFPSNLERKLPEVTAACQKVLVLLNDHYLKDTWNQKELLAFIRVEAAQHRNDWLVPVFVGKCKCPFMQDRPRYELPTRGKEKFDRAVESLVQELAGTRHAFVAMSFTNNDVNAMYNIAQQIFENEFKYKCLQLRDKVGAIDIVDTILTDLAKSDVVLCDLTDARPNCYYEAGYADALRREMIFTIREGCEPHFDLSKRRHIKWSVEGLKQLGDNLRQELLNIEAERQHNEREALRAAEVGRPAKATVEGSKSQGREDEPRRERHNEATRPAAGVGTIIGATLANPEADQQRVCENSGHGQMIPGGAQDSAPESPDGPATPS